MSKKSLKWQKRYRKFLQSPFWKDLTQRKILSSRGCEKCGSIDDLASHHRFYRENWFDTQLADLAVLCSKCHHAEHGLGQGRPRKGSNKPLRRAHIAKKADTAQSEAKRRIASEDFQWWKRDRWQNQFAVSSRPEVTAGVP